MKTLQQVLAFERRLYRRCAETTPLAWGEAVVRRDLPAVHDLNTVIVDAPPPSPEEVVATADRLLAGLDHRRLRIEDPRAARLLLPHLGGWQRLRHLGMAAVRPPDRAVACHRTCAVPLEDYRAFDRAATAAESWGTPAVVDQLAVRLDLYGAACDLLCFLATSDGEVAAGCLLLADGEAAQVDAVHVLAPFRGRGLGREVTAAAVTAAVRQGRTLIHLFADADDWPLQLYRRMGFEDLGSIDLLLRSPA